MDVNLPTIAMRLLRQLLEAPASHVRQRQTVLQPRFLSPRRAVIKLVLVEVLCIAVAALRVNRLVLRVKPVPMMAMNAALQKHAEIRMEAVEV
jgi:hypothetical protein